MAAAAGRYALGGACGAVVCGLTSVVSSLAAEQRFRGDGLAGMHDIRTMYRCDV